MEERRRFPRRAGPFEGTFEGASGPLPCRFSDISWTGCFVQTPEALNAGSMTVLTLVVSGGVSVMRARVVAVVPGFGFSVEFSDLDHAALQSLHPLLGEPSPENQS